MGLSRPITGVFYNWLPERARIQFPISRPEELELSVCFQRLCQAVVLRDTTGELLLLPHRLYCVCYLSTWCLLCRRTELFSCPRSGTNDVRLCLYIMLWSITNSPSITCISLICCWLWVATFTNDSHGLQEKVLYFLIEREYTVPWSDSEYLQPQLLCESYLCGV